MGRPKGKTQKGKDSQANFTEFDDEIDSCKYFFNQQLNFA